MEASVDLSAAEIELSTEPGRKYILKEFLLKIKDKYDYINRLPLSEPLIVITYTPPYS